jgi:hypothetical protein
MVTIRHCRTEDVADVLAFLEAHWKPGHIFTVERALFDWQHALPGRPGEYSMAIARRTADDALLGILGYIPTRRFDPSLAADNTVWLALWKLRDDAETAGLGLRLLTYVTNSEPHTAIGVIGFQAEIRPIYEALGFTVGELRHYVMPNPDVDRFELATLRMPALAPRADGDLTAASVDAMNFLERVAAIDPEAGRAQAPGKTPVFFLGRYVQHPIYRYRCDVVCRGGEAIGLLVTRLATHEGRRALRVIDYLGPQDAVPGLGSLILQQVRTAGAEYADVLNWGIDPGLFAQAGFSQIDPDGPDIVPNHFEPFEPRNIRVRFAIKVERPVVLFKGDGDQDRPSRMPQ